MNFYRYQPINKLSLRNLIKGQNWISNPQDFNDPFEFYLADDYYYSDKKGNYIRISEEEKIVKNEIKKEIDKYGVICYSSSYDNRLLWSHYADNHQGMALVFEIPNPEKSKVRKVKYQKLINEIKLDSELEINEEIIKICTTKSDIWEYEDEYREIYQIKNTHVEYKGELKEIIFGSRTNYEDIVMVSNLSKRINSKIKISRMALNRDSYFLSKISIGNNSKIPEMWKEINRI
jgi:hypothetical protein